MFRNKIPETRRRDCLCNGLKSPIMNKSSTWTALRNPAFRKLWIATVISGTCVAAYDSAATWMMNISTGSPFLLSLMSPVCFVNVGLAATVAGLAVLGWLHLLNPYLILVSVFLIGVGFAFDAPAWTSIVPQVVSDAELPYAANNSTSRELLVQC